MRIIVDTNKFLSALISSNGQTSQFFFSSEHNLVSPHFVLVELFKHKEKIISAAKKTEPEVLSLLHNLLSEVTFINEKNISLASRQKAFDLCIDVDPNDLAFVALSIELDAPLWTGDKKLIAGLKGKGFDNFFTDFI